MKTKEYIKKYELDKSDKFNHNEFVSDLTIDFMTLLEVGKATENLKGFENGVRAIKMKFDAINNKTVGCIPDKLWKYFYATVIVKMREELFPTEMQRQREDREERKRRYEERKKWENEENGNFWNYFFGSTLLDMFKISVPTDSFTILGLTTDADESSIKSAYRSLSKIHHPDMSGKQDKFIEITEAKNKCLMYLKNK